MCTALVIGNTIGHGIFVSAGLARALRLQCECSAGASPLIGMTVLARVFARLAREFPRGGWSVCLHPRPPPVTDPRSSRSGATGFPAGSPTRQSRSASSLISARSCRALDGLSPAVQAVTLLWLCVLVNTLGARMGRTGAGGDHGDQAVPMAAVMLLGAWLLVTEPVAYTRNPPTTPLTLADLMAASTIALFAMLGIESAAVPAGRVRDPERTIPRATMVGTLATACNLPCRVVDGPAADPAAGAGRVERSVRGPC